MVREANAQAMNHIVARSSYFLSSSLAVGVGDLVFRRDLLAHHPSQDETRSKDQNSEVGSSFPKQNDRLAALSPSTLNCL